MKKNVHLDELINISQGKAKHYPPKDRSAVPLYKNIAVNSRDIEAEGIFLALQGTQQDGENYIPAAIKNGATCVFCRQKAYEEFAPLYQEKVRFFVTADVRELVSDLAQLFYPNHPKYLLGVTGTNGKSSVVGFVQQLLALLDIDAASIGTLGVCAKKVHIDGSLTTPDPITLYKMLNELAEKGVECVAIEASSHGLVQKRLANIKFDAAGFTNITREHLDYHGSFHDYFEAKQLIFKRHLKPGGTAVINADIPEFHTLDKVCEGHQRLAYGKGGRDLHLSYIQSTKEGQQVSLEVFGQKHHATIPLLGRFQISNILCAMGLIVAVYGRDIVPKLIKVLPQLTGVPGRLEYVGQTAKGARVYIDYAHTPDALEIVLQALRHHTKNHLHVVFGCGGNRDKGKRPLMGQIASRYADHVIITDDNPRFESPDQIRKEICAGCSKSKNIADRREAIHEAVGSLEENDVLLIAGKGHEEGQKVGNKILPFHDGQVAKEMIGVLIP